MTENLDQQAPATGSAVGTRPFAAGAALPWLALALAVAVVALRSLLLYDPSLIMDDAYIYFRYANHLADGVGPVFNLGERVEGYTSFLWVALLALGRRLGFDIPSVSAVLAFASTAVTLVLLHRLGARVTADLEPKRPWLALVPPLAFAAMAAPARYIGSGMETSLVVCLVLGGLTLYLRGAPPGWVGLLFALATLTRPDCVLAFGLVVAYELLWGEGRAAARWRRAGMMVASFAALYLPYFLWRYLYYGWLLPNPFYTKVGGLSLDLLRRGLRFLMQAERESSLELPLALGVVGTIGAWRHRPVRLLASFVLLTAAYFVLVGGDFLFLFGPRFLMPAVGALLVLASVGIAVLARVVPARLPRLRQVGVAAGATLLLANAALFSWPATKGGDLRLVAVIQQGWIEVGKWLAIHTPPGTTLAVQPAGAIPYYSDRYAIDMFGLTDSHIGHLAVHLGKGPAGHEKFDIGYILERAPDYLVFMRLDPAGRPMLADWEHSGPRVEELYRLVALGRGSPSVEPRPWVIEVEEATATRLQEGYVVGIYRRRSLDSPPPLAGDPAAPEPGRLAGS